MLFIEDLRELGKCAARGRRFSLGVVAHLFSVIFVDRCLCSRSRPRVKCPKKDAIPSRIITTIYPTDASTNNIIYG